LNTSYSASNGKSNYQIQRAINADTKLCLPVRFLNNNNHRFGSPGLIEEKYIKTSDDFAGVGAESEWRELCSKSRHSAGTLREQNLQILTILAELTQKQTPDQAPLLSLRVDKYLAQPEALRSGVRISRGLIARGWTLRKVK
jgi:hypothetical protein